MKKVSLLLIILLTVFCVENTFAAEEYYTTQSGLVIPMEDYEYLQNHIPKNHIEVLSQDSYEALMDDVSIYNIVDEKALYISTMYYKDPMGRVTYYEEEITEEEYENYNPVTPYVLCSDGEVCWETNAKKIHMTISTYGNKYTIDSTLQWKTMPKVRSYDVNAIRWETSAGSFVPTSYHGVQFINYGEDHATLDSGRYVVASNGIGFSMKMGEVLDFTSNVLTVSGYFTANTVAKFTITYQHATQALTLDQSRSYTFNENGLGGVLYYSNASIRNAYDNMSGVWRSLNVYA